MAAYLIARMISFLLFGIEQKYRGKVQAPLSYFSNEK